MHNSQLTSIDLFAGCGGLSLGLEQAGFQPLFVNEINNDALDTYLMNREEYSYLKEDEFHKNDIKDCINPDFFTELFKNLKKKHSRDFRKHNVDLVAGGPPCQGFSGIGLRRSYSVEKNQLPSNQLFQDMAYFIHMIRPKVFLFENVEGLLRGRWSKDGEKGEIFEEVFETFNNIPDYFVKYKLVRAFQYGVPQNRPRLLIVGINKKIRKNPPETLDAVEAEFLPEPSNGYPDLIDVLGDIIDSKFKSGELYGGSTTKYPFPRDKKSDIQKYFRTKKDKTIAGKGHPLTEHDYSNHRLKTRDKFQAMISNGGLIPEEYKTKKFAQRVLPKVWTNGRPNITTCSLADDFVHFSQARSLTVREWARIQTFPDWYQFAGNRTTGGIRRAGNPREGIHDREVPKYTQIGNAVPVKLAKAIGDHFKKILK
jgi:DNA (cytosine-5)-methyltransferase 1